MQRLSLHNAKNYEMIENWIYNFWRILNWLIGNVDAQHAANILYTIYGFKPFFNTGNLNMISLLFILTFDILTI